MVKLKVSLKTKQSKIWNETQENTRKRMEEVHGTDGEASFKFATDALGKGKTVIVKFYIHIVINQEDPLSISSSNACLANIQLTTLLLIMFLVHIFDNWMLMLPV